LQLGTRAKPAFDKSKGRCRIARKAALKVAEGETDHVTVDAADVRQYIGPPRFYPEEATKGITGGRCHGNGMDRDGWRSVVYRGNAVTGRIRLTITGQIGDVMQESARAARSYFGRTRLNLGSRLKCSVDMAYISMSPPSYSKGWSKRGVTMTAALASLYTGRGSGPILQ